MLYLVKMRKFLLFLLIPLSVFANNDNADSSETFEFERYFIIPIGAYSEEAGVILGAGMLFFIQPGAEDGSSAGSNLATMVMTSLKKQATIQNKFVYEPHRHFNLLAYLYLDSWATKYFGVGNDLDEDEYSTYTLKGVRLPFALGTDAFLPSSWNGLFRYAAEFDLEYAKFQGMDIKDAKRFGAGYNLTYNSAERNEWSRKGSFVQFKHIFYNSGFVRKIFDTRTYIPLSFLPEGAIALGSFLEDLDGDVPFDRLAKPDGIMQLRGWEEGLMADKTFWVLQAELRTHLFWRIKGALFYDAGKVANSVKELNDSRWHRAIGAGARFLVNKKTKSHVRADFSIVDGKDFGMAIKINEAF